MVEVFGWHVSTNTRSPNDPTVLLPAQDGNALLGFMFMGSNVFKRISECAIVYRAMARTNMHLHIVIKQACRFSPSWERNAHPRSGASVGGDMPPKHFDHHLVL